MNVLSLFDGMGGCWITLKELGIKWDKGYSSEVDKFAIHQVGINFPDVVHLGSVTDVDVSKLEPIDLIMAGSPCQSFSFAGKRVGMKTTDNEEIYTLERYMQLKEEGFQFEGYSYLFWEFMRILTEVRQYNPDVKFFLENVEMGAKWERVLSEAVGVYGVHINGALVSAQNRKRIYWTNIRTRQNGLFGELHTDIPQPADRGILFKDILEDEVDEKYFISDKVMNRIGRRNYSKPKINPDKSGTLSSKNNSGQMSLDSETTLVTKGCVIDRDAVRFLDDGKSNCIDAHYSQFPDNHGARTGICVAVREREEGGKLSEQNLIIPENTKKGLVKIKPGECFGMTQPGNKTRRGRRMSEKCNCLMAQSHPDYYRYERVQRNLTALDGKSNCLLSTCYKGAQSNGMPCVVDDRTIKQLNPDKNSGGKQPYQQDRIYDVNGIAPALCSQHGGCSPNIFNGYRIRRLTPTECARLQTVPDWYKWGCSETQQYKMLGNGWCIEVIKHIMSHMEV